MKNINVRYYSYAFISVGCSNDFVEIAPVGVLESDTFLNKEENAEQALIGLYDLNTIMLKTGQVLIF
jgi:glutathionylspermidine synthase